ncbi:glutamate receptor 3.7-like [Carica papaya]|uniref:glutamate receptor 3.7-like n=1 Tax=Carica papaya TaxID=3649 RepID=UPI000B8D1151|nr:glutamate receptor 3.7-like [Carica papaya]
MKLTRVSLAPFYVMVVWVFLASCVSCQRPHVVKIGAIFAFDSVIGKAAKPAIEAAVSDVNADPRILNGTELKLIIRDNNCSVFLDSISVFQVIAEEVVAIIGPSSSSIAHMIGEVANGLRVPLVSFAATDPTLSSLQFPYFLRTTPSDSSQMAAIANLTDFYGWKEVIAIYVDDDYGRNGIAALDDELDKKSAKISCKLPLPVGFDENNITVALNSSKLRNTRVYVVHLSPDPRLRIFKVAQKLGMMTSNHVWFATDWLSVTLESFSAKDQVLLNSIQGVLGLRQHIPDSSRKKELLFRWRNMHKKGSIDSPLNVYGLRAYDTVWAVAYGLDKFINDQNNVTFSFNHKLIDMKASKMQIGKLKVFEGGAFLRKEILQANFTGLAGQVHFDASERNIVNAGYDILNIDQMRVRTVGYWSKDFGLSVSPPETLRRKKYSFSLLDQRLQTVIWPGGETEKPRGWVVANNEKPLKIGVPYRVSFVDFVTENKSSHEIVGYCIDVFMEAQKHVPYDVPYSFELFGDGHFNPSYNELVNMVYNGELFAGDQNGYGGLLQLPLTSCLTYEHLGPVEEELDYIREGPSDPIVAPGCMVVAPNCTVVVSDDTVEEQNCTKVALDPLVVGVTHIMAMVEGQTAPSSLLWPAGQR